MGIVRQTATTAICQHTPIDQCSDDDGCCPNGCDETSDSDCATVNTPPNAAFSLSASTSTWSGTVVVQSDVTVPEGEVLTIAPGTRVLFVHLPGNVVDLLNPQRDQQLDPG